MSKDKYNGMKGQDDIPKEVAKQISQNDYKVLRFLKQKAKKESMKYKKQIGK